MYYIHKSINKTFYAYQLCFSSPLNHIIIFLFGWGGGGVGEQLVGREGVHIYELIVNTVMDEALWSYKSL